MGLKKRHAGGRPPSANPKTRTLTLHLTDAQYQAIVDAAEGTSLSAFCRALVLVGCTR